MSSPVLIAGRTAAELETVAGFFGIDLEINRHIFRHAAGVDGSAFEVVMRALAEAVEHDRRFGTGRRIRENAAKVRAMGGKAS